MIQKEYYARIRANLRHPTTVDALDYLWHSPTDSAVRQAFCLAGYIHGDEKRRGLYHTPVLSHILRVYSLVAGVTDDPLLHQAALLHDTLEDYRSPEVKQGQVTNLQARTEAQTLLRQHTTPDVLQLVEQLSNPLSYGALSKQEWQVAHMPHMPLGIRLVKIADQLANAMSVVEEPEQDQARASKQLRKNKAVAASCMQNLDAYLAYHPDEQALLPALHQMHTLFMQVFSAIEHALGPDLLLPAHCLTAANDKNVMDFHLATLHHSYPWVSQPIALAA